MQLVNFFLVFETKNVDSVSTQCRLGYRPVNCYLDIFPMSLSLVLLHIEYQEV